MIAFLPVARYRVSYQVASGRPYSSFERLLLKAILRGNATLDSLADLFRLHRRMVIEGIVTLMQAGWVCLGPDGSNFISTPSGRAACESASELPATIIVSNKATSLLMEKVSGQLARGSDLDLYTKQKLEKLWAAGVAMPPSDISNIIEPGMITQLLPHEPGEWVRLVGPISVMTDNRLYAIVDVDVSTRKVTGIPQAWHALLVDDLVDRVKRAQDKQIVAVGSDEEKQLSELVDRGCDAPIDASRQTEWEQCAISGTDLLVGANDHRQELTNVLRSARSYVGIVSSTISKSSLEAVIPEIRSALGRDVLISVLWCNVGEPQQEHSAALDVLKKLEYDTNHGQFQGRLVVNSAGFGTSVNVLISDQASGVETAFGSYQWLCSSDGGRYLSIKLGRASIGARFCDFIADLASKDERIRTSSAVTALRKCAASLRSSSGGDYCPAGAVSIKANVFFDEAVVWYADDLIRNASGNVHLTADQSNTAGLSSFIERLSLKTGDLPSRMVAVVGGQGVSEMQSDIGRMALSHVSDMHANTLLVDSSIAVVSSRSWFDGAPIRCKPYGASVALALRGEGITNLLAARIGLEMPPAARS